MKRETVLKQHRQDNRWFLSIVEWMDEDLEFDLIEIKPSKAESLINRFSLTITNKGRYFDEYKIH